MKKVYSIGEIKKLPESEISFDGEIEAEFLEKKFNESLEQIARDAELPGFRKGKAPTDLVLKRIGDMSVLDDASEKALDSVYADMIEETKLRVIGRPKVVITKIARGNPLGFTITIAILPEIKLPDYKKISKEIMNKEEALEVSDDEIENTLLEIRKHHFHNEQHKNGVWTDHDHGEIKKEDLPEFTDELAKKFGQFEGVLDMKNKLRENILKEKTLRLKEKKRTAIIETIIEKIEIEVPRILVDNELDTMLTQFEGDITKSGLTFDDYLSHIKKTTEDLRLEWKDTAIKKSKAQMILAAIAAKEKISPDAETIRKETEKLLIVYPGADPVSARSYVAMHLANEKVFSFLEGKKETEGEQKLTEQE